MGSLTQLQQIGLGASGFQGVGSLFSGVGQYQSGQAQKSAYNYNAAVALEQSHEQMETSESKFSTLIGRQASLYAKAGVDITKGSPLLVMAHTAAQGGKEQERERAAGQEQATMDRYYGKVAAYTGTTGGITSFLSGLSSSSLSAVKVLS
jgi:hypothetical protein